MSLWEKIVAFFTGKKPNNKPKWKPAVTSIKAAMVTPMFVNSNNSAVKAQSNQLVSSKIWNSVVSLVDLQKGRSYIFPGRNRTSLDSKTLKNIKTVLDAGLTPILIIRNDWAVRNNISGIPSCNGGGSTNGDFYKDSFLNDEKKFLLSIKELWPYIHIQLSIEASSYYTGDFSVKLSKYLRDNGFTNKIIINPMGAGASACEELRNELNKYSVKWARSRNGSELGSDHIINTDGNTSINSNNFKKDWLPKLSREYIVWSKELANVSDKIQQGYL